MKEVAQMKDLIKVGFYRELSRDPGGREDLPSILEAISSLPQEDEDQIVAYLRNAVCLSGIGCYVNDVLDPSSRVPLTPDQCTDGTYYWRLDIAHYVEKYHLRLPPAFVRHMASRNWQPPAEEEVYRELKANVAD